MTDKTVGDIMTRDVIALREEENLSNIAKGMDRFHLRHLPVVDGKKLRGLVTHRDILRMTASALDEARLSHNRDASIKEATFVSSVMTRNPTSVKAETPLSEALRMMLQGKFGCLPVVDADNNLIGIVTEYDFLKEFARQLHAM